MTLLLDNVRLATAADVFPTPSPGTPATDALPLRSVLVDDGVVVAVGQAGRTAPTGAERVDGEGAMLLPGLHDHHLHLLATAAALGSVDCSPAAVARAGSIGALLAAAAHDSALDTTGDTGRAGGAWLRGTGYDDPPGTGPGSGQLNRDLLDSVLPHRPVRIQHRSGAVWILNSAALALLPDLPHTPDVERDAHGRPTGRLFRSDRIVGEAAGRTRPDLSMLGRRLAAVGITGVTDATPDLDDDTIAMLDDAVTRGHLPPRVTLLGAPLGGHRAIGRSAGTPAPGLVSGPWKIHLHDHNLPDFDEFTQRVFAARQVGRAVAVHCVTRESLILTLAVLDYLGPRPGDRIEHASIVPPELVPVIAKMGLAVVTQPWFLTDRGDDYLRSVHPADLDHLYPYARLLRAGIPVAPSSDAPYATIDPWATITAAATRCTRGGRIITESERVDAATALAGYLSPPHAPGTEQRRIALHDPADLCLVTPVGPDGPGPQVLLTVAAGRIVHAG